MRAADRQRLCHEAQVYYYDLLCPDEGAVPESVRRHAATCPVCQEQIRRLRETLGQSPRHPGLPDAGTDETVEALAEQFRLLDEQVTCSDTKPYLPELALASPAIRIPTPVTVHVDQCPPCAEDVAALRRLHLTADQLKRLKQLFESYRDQGSGVCTAKDRVGGPDAVATAAPLPSEGSPTACREVSTAALFDYVVPDGEPPAAIASHIRACPACRARARTLRRTISGIVARADSETTTIYHAGNDTEDAREQRQQTYRYPVSVQVLHGPSGGAPDRNDSSHGLRNQQWATYGLRRRAESLARVAVIAVAVASLALLLRTTAPTASGLYGSDVLKALAQAPNVRVVITDRHGRLAQEYWIARHSNRLLYRTTQRCVLYDLDQDRKRTLEPLGAASVSDRLSEAERNRARRAMAGYIESNLERIVPETKGHLPPGEVNREGIRGLDVYELQVLRQTGYSSQPTREWAYIDPATGLPQRTEAYRKIRRAGPWELLTTTVFTYPSESEIAETIGTLFPAE